MSAHAFAFTKLVVRDLDRGEAFYSTVFGLVAKRRLTVTEHAFALEEVVLSLKGGHAHALVLTRYLDRPAPPAGAAWTGFTVADIEETLAEVARLGGTICVPMHENAEHRVRAALVADPEGHMIEIVQLLAG